MRHLRMRARDERAVCGVERASSRGGRGDGQPVQRSKPRVGHGGLLIRARAALEWGLQNAGKHLVFGLGEIIQTKLDGARVVAEVK